jgi:hypothetical protein
MKSSLSLDLVVYGVILVTLSVVAHLFRSEAQITPLWIGTAGGVLSTFTGALGLRGRIVRPWAIALMVILSVALLVPAVSGWLAVKAGGEIARCALIQTLLWVFAVGQLANLIQNRNNVLFRPQPADFEKKP